MSSNLKVNTILPSTGTTIGIGTVGGLINVVGNIDVNSTSGISTFNGLEISGIVTAKAGAAVTYYGDGSNLTGITDNVVTINNNANNRLITGSGSANTLEGEANLTFDGDGLLSMTSSSGPAEITLVAPSANDSGIYFNDGSNDGAISYDHSTRKMNFRANSQTKFIIEGDTKKLLIQRAPSSDVDIVLARAQRWGYSAGWQGLIIGNPTVGNMSSLFLNYDPSSNTSGSFSGDGREIVVRKNAKMIVPNAADNAFYNAIEFNCGGSRDDGVSRFRQGIIVSNDSADANVLDDYEEGTFTPQWNGGSGGVSSITYGNTNGGNYVKIGNLVTVTGKTDITGSTGGSGFWYLGNMPFLVYGGGKQYNSVGAVSIENFNMPATTIQVVATMEQNNNNMHLHDVRDNQALGTGISINNDGAFSVQFSITYRTA